MKVVIYADGGSRGNPGVAGSGTVVYAADSKEILREIAYVVGTKATNNVAEYHGLLRGLEAARELGVDDVEFYMDSKLVVEQINGRWKIKHPDMQKLALEARRIIAGLSSFRLEWVPRAKNKVADALSNDAMDAAAKGEPVGIVGGTQGSGAPAVSSDSSEVEKPSDTAAPAPEDWLGQRGPVTRFILVRHGQTEFSRSKKYSGHSDPELTELGNKQALACAQALSEVDIDAIVSSPLSRCRATARTIAQGREVDVETVEGLIELDFGVWEAKTFEEVRRRDPKLHQQWLNDASVSCPGGESLQNLHRRVRRTRSELQTRFAGKTVLVVSHVNPIKSFLRQGLDAGPATFHRMFVDLASISTVDFWEAGAGAGAEAGAMVRGFNDVGHLAGLR